MKKIITTALIATAFLTTNTSAFDFETTSLTSIQPIVISENVDTKLNDSKNKYEIIIRNNIIESDYEYNNVNYYTTKIKTENLVIPEEVSKKATNIYFLVEEGQSRIYYAKGIMDMAESSIDEVKKEYNYKKVDFNKSQKEYIFNNKDLVKDFWNWKYSNVQITLMADFWEGKTLALSNTSYVSIWNKLNTLDNLKNSKDSNNYFFGYYNTQELEKYLEKYSEKLTRSEYKKVLSKAESKIKSWLEDNEKIKEKILKSINNESDFNKHVEKYTLYKETNNLLSSLSRSILNQIQSVRAFDAIDSILR